MAAATGPAAELSAQEAEIYDRQIRLWGVESQQRMQNSRVLLAGAFRGIMAEVCAQAGLLLLAHAIQNPRHGLAHGFP
mgnify:CR=1 FL=1